MKKLFFTNAKYNKLGKAFSKRPTTDKKLARRITIIAILFTVFTVTSCKENILTDDNTQTQLQEEIEKSTFVGEWYDVYSNDIKWQKVIFTENHVTAYYYSKEKNGNEYYDSADYNKIEYFILPDNKIQFNRDKINDIYHDGTGKHITPYTFSGDTLIIKYFIPTIANVVYPGNMRTIALLKDLK